MTSGESGRAHLIHELMLKMIGFDAGDPKRIQHFIKVHSLARTIGTGEGADDDTLFTLEAAAIVHDIGIHPAEEKHAGRCDGKLQELEGPAPARAMLEGLGFPPSVTDRVVWLVGHHHTYAGISGLDYRALVEADFLVNLYEDGTDERGIRAALGHVFATKTGRHLLCTMFGIEGE